MNKPPDDIRQWIQELISRSASDQMVNQKRFEELLRLSARGDIDQATLRSEYLRFAQQEGTRYIRDLTRVGLGFYNTLLELNRQYNDRFYTHVLHEDHAGNGYAPSAQPALRVVDMEFRGVLGSDVTRTFAIENQRPQAVSVGFLISEFTDPAETVSFRPPLQFTPARFSLRPGEERMVTISVPLLDGFFQPGQSYAATVVVSGFEQLQLRLKVTVDAQAAADTQPKRRSPVYLPVEEPATPPVQPEDDLTRIKGVGPTFLQKFHQAGLKSFASLANCDQAALEHILGKNGLDRLRRQQWQEQARLAARNDWASLAALQATLA